MDAQSPVEIIGTILDFSLINRILSWHRRIFNIFGIPVYIHISILFFVWPALQTSGLTLLFNLEYAFLIVFSILCHELGHALTAKYFRESRITIMLHGFGGYASGAGSTKPSQQLLIVLAGPAVTFLFAGLCFAIAHFGGDAIGSQAFIFEELAWIEVLMGFLNLIPVLPWDGGLALQAILNFKLSAIKAIRAAAHFGLILAPFLLVFSLTRGGGFYFLFALVGILTCYMTLRNSGGIRFGEVWQDRKARKEELAYQKRQKEKREIYIDDVIQRQIEREEKERLRKLLGED